MKKVLQILSLLLVLTTVTVGVVVFAQAETAPSEAEPDVVYNFNDLTTGPITSIPKLNLSGSGKTGVWYEIVEEDSGNKYVRWFQGTMDSAFDIPVKGKDFLEKGEDTVTFSIDLRADAEYATTVAGTMRIRRGKPADGSGGWNDVVNVMSLAKDGTISAAGVPLMKLDPDAFHTYSFVADFTSLTMDAYIDGVLAAADIELKMPSEAVLGPDVNPVDWLYDCQLFNWQSNTNTAGDSSLLIDNIEISAGDIMNPVAGSPLVLYANGGTFDSRPVSYTPGTAYTLPEPKLAGAKFLGWYATADFSGEAVKEVPATATGTQCFYAKWDKQYTVTFVNEKGEEAGTTTFMSSEGKYTINIQEPEGYAWFDTSSRRLYHNGAVAPASGDVKVIALRVYGPFTDGDEVYVDIDYSESNATTSSNSTQTLYINTGAATVTYPKEGDNVYMQLVKDAANTSDFTYYLQGNDTIVGMKYTIGFSLRSVEGVAVPAGYVGYKSVGTAGPELLNFAADGTLTFCGQKVGMLSSDEWMDFTIVFDGTTQLASLYINGLRYVEDASYAAEDGVARPIYFYIRKGNAGTLQMDNLKIYNGDAYLTEVKGDALVLDLDGGTVEGELPTTYDPEKPLTLPVPTKEKATFRGWYTNPEFTGEPVLATPAGASGALFYYAKWGYMVSFDGVEQEMTGTITLPETAGDVSVGWWKTQVGEEWVFYNPNDTYQLNADIAFVSVSEEVKANTEGVIAVAGEIPLDVPYFALQKALTAADPYKGKETEADYPGLAEAEAHIAAARAKLQQIIDNQEMFLALVDQMKAAADLKEKAAYAVDARALQAVLDITYPEVPEANLALTEVLADVAVAELMRAADAYLAAVATLTPGANYQTVKAAAAAAADPGTVLADLFANSEVLSGAKATLDSMNAAADALAEMAEDFIAGVTALDLNADYATFVAAMEALEGTVVTDVTVPGVAEVIEKYETAQARLEALKGIQTAFFNSIAQLETTLDYATIAAIVETAEKLKPFIDPTTEGLADAEEALTTAKAMLVSLEEYAKAFIEAVEDMAGKTTYSDRKDALAVATAMSAGVDDTYPGVKQAKRALMDETDALAANDAFASQFNAAVQKFMTGLRIQDQYRAYADAYALSRDERLDLTNPIAKLASDSFATAVATYNRNVNSANDAMADALQSVSQIEVAGQQTTPASVSLALVIVRLAAGGAGE